MHGITSNPFVCSSKKCCCCISHNTKCQTHLISIFLPPKKVCLCLFLLCAAFYSAFVVVPFISLMSYKYCYYFQVIFKPSLTLRRVLFAGSGSPKAFHELVFICSFARCCFFFYDVSSLFDVESTYFTIIIVNNDFRSLEIFFCFLRASNAFYVLTPFLYATLLHLMRINRATYFGRLR